MLRPGQLLVLSATAKRDTGRTAQLQNISAGKEIADIIRTSLGFIFHFIPSFHSKIL
jgi:T-complex protein 1 subunit gamma